MAYRDLSLRDRAAIIRAGVANGIRNLTDIEAWHNASLEAEAIQNEETQEVPAILYGQGGSIHIKPENRGKFNATKARTGKTTEELTHSKNPLTRKRAIFAQNARKWKHEDGGYLGHRFTDGGSSNVPAPITTQGAMPVPSINYTGSFLDSPLFGLSARLMEGVHYAGTSDLNFGDFIYGITHKNPYSRDTIGNRTESLESTPQDAYLLPTKLFNRAMLDAGYLKGSPGDYGTVISAAVKLGNKLGKSIPVYQTYPDAITKDKLVHLGSDVELHKNGSKYLGQLYGFFLGHPSEILHPGNYASAYYMNPKNGLLYLKAWDLNDYSPSSSGDKGAASFYGNKSVLAATLLDKIGNPSVVTTGFQPASLPSMTEPVTEHVGITGKYPEGSSYLKDGLYRGVVDDILAPLLAKKGLYKHVVDDQYFFSPLEEEVIITPNKKAQGGKIHIKPSRKGTFTAAATKHGKSVQEFARQVLANKENYSTAMVRKANFARNAAGWKHSTGGVLYPFSFSKQPLPAVRYADGGSTTRDWDNTLTGQLINYVENSDSIGWNPNDRTWEHPTLPGYDKNQIGMGVDKNKTAGYWDVIQYRKNGTPYMTEADERALRYAAIENANNSANKRYKYAQEQTGHKEGTISKVKDAAVVSAIYNLGQGYVANGLFEDKNFMESLFTGTDKQVVDRVNEEYHKKKRNERINKTNLFLGL